MGDVYHLYCRACEESLWIGQRGAGNSAPRIYWKPENLFGLNMFLIKHRKHDLVFGIEGIDFPFSQKFDLEKMINEYPDVADELIARYDDSISQAIDEALKRAVKEIN